MPHLKTSFLTMIHQNINKLESMFILSLFQDRLKWQHHSYMKSVNKRMINLSYSID